MFCKKFRKFLINRKLKKLNKELVNVPDIKQFLVLENKRLDLMEKINKINRVKL
jgi:hypothetical protein